MTTAIDSQIDAIYRKHMAAVQRLDGTWIDASVFRYALSMALEELAGSVQATEPAPQSDDWLSHIMRLTVYLDAADALVMPEAAVDRAIELLRQNAGKVISAEKLLFWLEQNGLSDLNPYGADTAIELIESQREEISRMNARIVELSDLNSRMRDEIALARGEITDLQTKLRATVHTGNGAGLVRDFAGVVVNPPTAAAAVEPNDWHQRITVWFADNVEVLDWYESIRAGRNAFRNLPKEARWHLIAFIVRSLRNPETGEWPTMAEFDRNRPEWMSTSQAAVITFGNGRWQSVLDKAEVQ